MMENDYRYSITQTNCVINSLEEDVKNRIPQNVINFFNNNSDISLINQEYVNKNIMFESFTDDTLKFLKIIDYYINN